MTRNQMLAHKPHPYAFICMNMVHVGNNAITIQDIDNAVCEYFKMPPNALQERSRRRTLVIARQSAMYIAKKLTHLSLREIGEHFGGYDHTTVLYSCDVVADIMDTQPKYKEDIDNLFRYFGN